LPAQPEDALRSQLAREWSPERRENKRLPARSSVAIEIRKGTARAPARLADARRSGHIREAAVASILVEHVGAVVRDVEVNIAVAMVTAGIRGTDLWGRSRDDRQIVCLIEGKIQVAAEGEAPATMDQSRQFYVREKGRTQPIALVEPQQLNEWAKETEIERGKGAARRGGKWSVTLASVDTQRAALEVYDAVRKAGYPAQIDSTKEGDKRSYHVRIRNLPSKAEANALAGQLRGKYGVEKTAVSG